MRLQLILFWILLLGANIWFIFNGSGNYVWLSFSAAVLCIISIIHQSYMWGSENVRN